MDTTDSSVERGIGFALLAMWSAHTGIAIAHSLMSRVGPAGATFLRQIVAAVVLLAVARPRVRSFTRQQWGTAVGLGVVLAGMNLSLYASVERIPMGVAVTIELLGPLGLAAGLSRRAADLAWVALAVAGVVLLGRPGGGLDGAGVVLAVVAATGWACYIALQRRAGAQAGGLDVLACAIAFAAMLIGPFALRSGSALVSRQSLGLGVVIAVLGALVPFSCDLRALRTVPPRVFGVLMSVSPAIAAIVGLVLLDERLGARELVGMAAVVLASGATVWTNRSSSRSVQEPSLPGRDLIDR